MLSKQEVRRSEGDQLTCGDTWQDECGLAISQQRQDFGRPDFGAASPTASSPCRSSRGHQGVSPLRNCMLFGAQRKWQSEKVEGAGYCMICMEPAYIRENVTGVISMKR